MNTDSSSDDESLAERIDAVRITYPEREVGVGIEGRPFTLEFETPIDLDDFHETVFTAASPWHMWGIYHLIDDGYRGYSAVAYHVDDDGEPYDSTKLDLELCTDWMRVYVKGEDASAERVAEFVRTVCDHYDATVEGLDDRSDAAEEGA